MLRRIGVLALFAAIAFGVWISVRVSRNNADRSRASAVVSQLGGRMGSLPVLWRAEYHIAFRDARLARDDLKRLAVLNPLAERNSVRVDFIDTNLTGQDVRELREMLPRCKVHRVVGNEWMDD